MRWNCLGRFSTARVSAAACWGGLLILVAGCGGPSLGKLVPVQGKVTLPDGTSPPDGQVVFHPIDRDPDAKPQLFVGGMIKEDGSYSLSTNGKPGALEGKYRVVLMRGARQDVKKSEWVKAPAKYMNQPGQSRGPGSAQSGVWSQVPAQYFSQQKTPLEVEVVENKPEGGYDLKLQAKKGRR
jgi:hypothetical protein